MITRFHGDYKFLSNFYPSPIEVRWTAYEQGRESELGWAPSLEHAYQAAKTDDMAKRREIYEAPTPTEAKRLGRLLPLSLDWRVGHRRLDVMKDLVTVKFRGDGLRALLLQTGDQFLMEGNTWHDLVFGVCFCAEHDGSGRNMLGQILMEVRETIRSEQAANTR